MIFESFQKGEPMCRGIVMSNVLAQGLSHHNVVSLKGLNWDKWHREFYPGSAPHNEVKAYSCFRLYCLGFDYQGANTLDLLLDLLFLALTCRRVTPLYTQADARWLIECRPAHTQCVWLGDRTKLSLTYKLNIWCPWASSLLRVLGL